MFRALNGIHLLTICLQAKLTIEDENQGEQGVAYLKQTSNGLIRVDGTKTIQHIFVILSCFVVLFLSFAKSESLAACSPSVKIEGDSYTSTSIQTAYDYASTTLGQSDFTLRLAGGLFSENLILNGGNVVLDGGYDCSFTT